MLTVWKYELQPLAVTNLEMPKGASVLTVAAQSNVPCLWALVDSDKPKVSRRFEVVGTGHDAGEASKRGYIGTFQLYAGQLMFHVFEVSGEL